MKSLGHFLDQTIFTSSGMMLRQGWRVELTRDLQDLKVGMRGAVHIDSDHNHIGVQFDGQESVSIGRMPGYPESKVYVRVIDCVKPI